MKYQKIGLLIGYLYIWKKCIGCDALGYSEIITRSILYDIQTATLLP